MSSDYVNRRKKDARTILAIYGGIALLALLLSIFSNKGNSTTNFTSFSGQSGSGQCQYEYQKAKDGSKCGKRAASAR